MNTSTGILSDTLKRQLKENKPALLKKLSNIEDNAIDINWPRLTADKEQQHQSFPYRMCNMLIGWDATKELNLVMSQLTIITNLIATISI